jgi:ligand-binding sensor domain-containing protein/two-component sensor histidine kinase
MKSILKYFSLKLLPLPILLYLFSPAKILSQDGNYTFRHITIEDGLSQSTIFSILQDRAGFMWFGTTDGLNRYDGYKFTHYFHNDLDTNSLSGNSIREIYEDGSGNLWIGTVEGVLNKFHRSTETFTHYPLPDDSVIVNNSDDHYYDYPLAFSRNINKTITVILEEDNDNLWVGTWGNGLYLFNKNDQTAYHYYNDPDDSTSLPSNRITKLAIDSLDNLWIGTFGGGLSRMKRNAPRESQTFFNYTHIDDSIRSISDDKVISLLIDHDNSLWVGTFHGGLNILDSSQMSLTPSDAKFKIYHFLGRQGLSTNSVMAITEDEYHNKWIGTFGGGLNKFNHPDTSVTIFTHNPFNENSISDNDILSLLVDNSGVIWIGTHLGKGLSKLETNSVKFGILQKETGNSRSLNDDVVWSIHQDTSSVLWIGTYRGGLNKYDRTTNTYTYYRSDDDINSISDDHVRAIKEDKSGNLWIGTYGGGLNHFDKAAGKFTRYMHKDDDESSLGSDQIQSIHIDSRNVCWIGTFGGGLHKFDINTVEPGEPIKFKKYVSSESDVNSISDNRIYCIYEDSKQNIWIGTFGGGLNKYIKESDNFEIYQYDFADRASISHNQILSIIESSDGNIWVGTYGGGLNKFYATKKNFERFGKAEGFASQVIYGILEDKNKNLWLSSDIGLSKYNLGTENITNYNLNDGLQSMEFSGGAYFKSEEGEMFFGGISGLNYFYPDSVRGNTYVPPVVISEFKIFNDVVKGVKDYIELSYDQNFFTIEYAALDYTDPENNQYAHILEGLENEWHYTDAVIRRAYYTNLEPGKYYFRVRGSNNDGVWNNVGLTLEIDILPPFWKTWWFIMLSIIFLGGLVSFLISMKVKHLLAIEKLKVRLAADLHDNVGAGLTEIAILSELTSNEVEGYSKSSADKLQNISDTARHLVDSMSDIVWFVNPQRDSLHDLIIRLKDSYSDLLSEIGISFKTNNIDNIIDVKIPMDVRQNLYLIFKEAINNSIKHSRCNKINLELKLVGNILEMTLQDDGKGIDENNIRYGNGLKNMQDRADTLGGKLYIKSIDSKGTVIRFVGRLERHSTFKFQWD